jgi:DNA-binding XRE family transcriptional regulator
MPQLQESELEQVSLIDIEKLPSMAFTEMSHLPNERSVYFALTSDGTVLYVGQTESLSRRWLSHSKKEDLASVGCSKIAWMKSEGDIKTLESAFVKRFRPSLNKGEKQSKRQVGMILGTVIQKYRVASDLTLRDISKEIGIGAATLMRLEQGRDPDGATLTKVLIWLFKPTTNGTQGKGRAVK